MAPEADTWLPLGKLRWPLQGQFNYNFAVGLQVTKEKVVSSGDPAQQQGQICSMSDELAGAGG